MVYKTVKEIVNKLVDNDCDFHLVAYSGDTQYIISTFSSIERIRDHINKGFIFEDEPERRIFKDFQEMINSELKFSKFYCIDNGSVYDFEKPQDLSLVNPDALQGKEWIEIFAKYQVFI